MAVAIPWAAVLVLGDYLSPVEIPTFGRGGSLPDYVATLERLRALLAGVEHVVPGHGQALAPARAEELLEQDLRYLASLAERPQRTELPPGRGGPHQRALHEANLAALAPGVG
jgi:hypothetical protein